MHNVAQRLFLPESLERLKNRFPAAVDPPVDWTDVNCFDLQAMDRHLFDFENGMRLVISRESNARSILFTAGVLMGSDVGSELGRLARHAGRDRAQRRFRQLAVTGFLLICSPAAKRQEPRLVDTLDPLPLWSVVDDE